MRRAQFAILMGAALVTAPIVLSGQSSGPAKRPTAVKPKAAPAKTPPPPAAEPPKIYPLESLAVTGNKNVPATRILAASGLKLGQPVQKSDFEAARDRLIATGAFDNVGYEYKPSASNSGYDAVLQIIEVPQFFAYRFEDLPPSEEALRAAARAVDPIFGDTIPPSAAVLDRFTKAVTKAAGVPVIARVNADAPGVTTIVFRSPNPRLNIAEVRFTGNDVLPTPTVLRSMNAVAIGVPFTEAGYRQMLDASLRPQYDARGRIRVKFTTISTQKAEKVEGLVVTTAIEEGPAYKMGEVQWPGVARDDLVQVEKAADIKKGDVANFDDVTAALARVHDRYLSQGYLKQTAKTDRLIDDEQHVVNLAIRIDPGPQYTFGKLTIRGLDLIAEPVIRKMWQLAPGKPYPVTYPDAFLKRVRDEDMFDNLGKTTADVVIDEKNYIVDVTLTFGGAPTQAKPRQAAF